MWYVIVAGVGVALGISLLVWALSERSKRSKAEKLALARGSVIEKMSAQLKQRDIRIAVQRGDAKRQEEQIEVLRATLGVLRKKLVDCRDPATIKAWLDEELTGGTV